MSSQPKQRRRCPSCGSSNPASATSCDMCGYVFGASDAGSSKRATSFRPAPSAQPVQPVQPHVPPKPPVTTSPETPRQPLTLTEAPSSSTPAEPADEVHVAPVEPASPPPVVDEAPSEPAASAPAIAHAAWEDEAHAPTSVRPSGASRASGAASSAKVEFKPKSQAAAYPARPRPASPSKPAAPYKPKATTSKRPIALSASRSRGLLSLVLIVGTVLGVVALLAIAIAGSGAVRDSSARPVMPTPIIVTEPATDALPAATATEAAPPVATATSAPMPSPLPTDTPPSPTETPAPQPTDTPAAQTNTVTYTVKQGDSCWAIATRFNVSVDDLIRQNNLTANCLIRPGQELTITR